MQKTFSFIIIIAMLIASASCGGGGSARCADGDTGEILPVRYSSHLSMTDCDGYTKVDIRNPWDTTKNLHTYILVPKDEELPSSLPKGTLVRTPVTDALVFSAVHVGLLKTLGAFDAVGGVCDAQYMHDPQIKDRINSGEIIYCGNGMTPDIESIMQERPQAILLSPFQNSNNSYGKVSELGIPIIECADYMESSPLGRAEWMRFYGLLFGKSSQADSLFSATEYRYNELKSLTASVEYRPKVIVDQRYGQIWNVPAANSTMGNFIEDAGGNNPFSKLGNGGSVALAPEKVLADAHDADIWFVRYNQKNPKTLEELASDAPVNSQFKAYKDGNVYGCNTAVVDFYGEIPFHPERLLADMISRIHPELDTIVKPKYRCFSKME